MSATKSIIGLTCQPKLLLLLQQRLLADGASLLWAQAKDEDLPEVRATFQHHKVAFSSGQLILTL